MKRGGIKLEKAQPQTLFNSGRTYEESGQRFFRSTKTVESRLSLRNALKIQSSTSSFPGASSQISASNSRIGTKMETL